VFCLEQWVEIARRGENHHVLYLDLMMQTFTGNRIGRTFGGDFSYVPSRYRQFAGARWFSTEEIDKYVSLLRKASSQGKVLQMGVAWEMQCEKARVAAKELKKTSFSGASPAKLLEGFNVFCDYAVDHWGHAYHYLMLNKFLPDEVAAEIVKRVPDAARQSEYLQALFSTEKPTEIRRENASLLKIAETLLKQGKSVRSPEGQKLIEYHLAKFAHLGRYYLRSKPYSQSDIVARISRLSLEEVVRKTAELEQQAKAPEVSRKIIGELKLDDELKQKVFAVKQFAFAANYADESYSFLVECVSPLLHEIASRYGLTWDELCSMQRSEITAMLLKDEMPSKEMVEVFRQRFADHAIILEDGKVRLLWGEALKKYAAEQEALKVDASSAAPVRQLKGLAAAPGKASGPAVIILSSKDLTKVKKGDVVVASMTTPEFVPALEKACAIVTDEGGILCHAAIVSRELQIPCVVGTRVATKLIKEGAMVEVDANKGRVTILD